jgi:Glyoxalase-like domain
MAAATAEDAEMNNLMAKWDAENNVEDVSVTSAEGDDEPEGYDEMLEKFRRTVTVTNNALDNIVLGTSNLEKTMDDFEEMTGVRPLMVVSMNGLGTKSARVAFESCAFLEFIGPDPAQGTFPLAQKLAKIPEGQTVPMHYAVRNSKAADMKDGAWKEQGFECDQVTMIAKDRGMPWKWDMYFLEGHDDGGIVPFFIIWGESHHAAGRLPIVGTLDSVTVRAPASSKVHGLLLGVDDIKAESGDNHFEFSFTTQKGTHKFSGSNLIGISYPK